MHHLSPAQIRNLELEGCFQVPSGPALNEFLRQYFFYVHSCLPLLDEGLFWDMYLGNADDYRKDVAAGFSLALFQAMLFAASRVSCCIWICKALWLTWSSLCPFI